jgi:uncharacterized protein YjiS (DUF1127 family)
MSVIPFPVARPLSQAATPKPALPLLAVWRRRIAERRELAGLDKAQLRDAGLDPALVYRETVKPFWRA